MQRYKVFADRWHPVKDDWGDYVLYYDAMLEIGRLTALACERQEIIEEQMQEIAARDNLITLIEDAIDNRQMVIGAIREAFGARR